MKHYFTKKSGDTVRIFVLCILWLGAWGPASTWAVAVKPEREGRMRLEALLLSEIRGWIATIKGEEYNRGTIFDYMDGAGEVYLA